MNVSDPYLQITEYTVPLAGLEREVTLLQVSDLHIAVADAQSSDAEREHVAEQVHAWESVRLDFARRYGDAYDEPHLLPPEEGLSHFVQLANDLHPDALLLTGDMMNEYSDANLRLLQAALARVNVPWMFVVGNHEAGHEAALSPLLQAGKTVQTLSVGNCKLIGLHDAQKKLDRAQLEAALSEAKDCVPVLVMHIPVLTAYNQRETSVFDPYFLLGSGQVDAETQAFLDELQWENSPFRLLLCGHVHGKHVSQFRPGCRQLCASSAMVGACTVLHLTKA